MGISIIAIFTDHYDLYQDFYGDGYIIVEIYPKG